MSMTVSRRQLLASAATLAAGRAFAELAAPNPAGVSMGHLHLNASDLEAQRKFWALLGAKPGNKLGANEVMKVRNALIMIRKAEVTGGTEGSVVNHIGFKIPDLHAYRAKVSAAGHKLLTEEEQSLKTHKSFVLGPDGVKVELVEDKSLDVPIANHHIHWFRSPVDETKAWYVKTFDAIPGHRDQFEAADLPGVNLSFSPSPTPVVGTKGRVLDHVGFEVHGLEAFTKKLEGDGVKFDVPYRRVNAKLAVAFFTDPFGTYIELTEGLAKF